MSATAADFVAWVRREYAADVADATFSYYALAVADDIERCFAVSEADPAIDGLLALGAGRPPESAAAAIATYAERVIAETVDMWPRSLALRASHEGLRHITSELRRTASSSVATDHVNCGTPECCGVCTANQKEEG